MTSWTSRDVIPVLRFEIAAAAARVGIDIREMSFEVQNPDDSAFARKQYDKWHVLMSKGGGSSVPTSTSPPPEGRPTSPCEGMIRRGDGSYKVSALLFVVREAWEVSFSVSMEIRDGILGLRSLPFFDLIWSVCLSVPALPS